MNARYCDAKAGLQVRLFAMTIPQITTARTRITLLEPQHARLLQHYCDSNRAHLAPWEPVRPPGYYTLAACEQRLRDSFQLAQENRGFQFAILDPASAAMIGACNFNNIVRGVFQACHLGYSIAATHQGQGLMFEALQSLLNFVFDELDLHRVMANYIAHNERSGKLLARLGFEREGYAKKYLKIAGQWQDHVLTAKVRERD